MNNTSDTIDTKIKGCAWVIFCVLMVSISFGVFSAFGLFFLASYTEAHSYHETNDLADYGEYIWNYENDYPQQFINAFFPDQIEPQFSDVTYHYKAQHYGPYACEAYLEFTIEDAEAYHAYFEETTNGMTGQVFRYDEKFLAYSIVDKLTVEPEAYRRNKETENVFYCFEPDAEMGQILFCHEEQRVIYTAIVTGYEGGYATDRFDAFYSRFDIDPLEYSNYVDSCSTNKPN